MDRDERLSDRIGKALAPDWQVFNCGMPGANTQREMEYIHEHGASADAMVLGYCMNDIQTVARAEGKDYPWVPPHSQISSLFRPWVHYSHLFNYFYARYAYGVPQVNFAEYMGDCYRDPEIWRLHSRELQDIIDYAEGRNIPLYVVVFPLLQDPAASNPYSAQVARFFQNAGIPAIDLGPILLNDPVGKLIANPLDPHPSAYVNEVAAKMLLPILKGELGE